MSTIAINSSTHSTPMDIRVVSEPLTYRRDAPYSMFVDMIDAERGGYSAKERLERHGREIQGEMERRDKEARDAKPSDLEYRTNPNTTAGQGGSFAPPLWIIDQFATYPRAKRVLADMIPSFPLPQGVHSVNLPRLSTGNTENIDPDLGGDADTDITDASVTSNVVTISGHGDVALQLLDQSPPGAHLDWAFFKDLTEAYDAELEAQLINGSGTGAQLTGLLNVTGNLPVTYTSGTPTATGMFTFLGQLISRVGNNRKLPPELVLMTTSRLGWLGSSEDQQQRPLMITDVDGSGKFDLMTIEVKLDDAMPMTLGATANGDTIIACRPSDMILLESAPHARVHLDVLSGTLQARIQLHCYVAALVGRYPSGISYLTGTGTVIQSGFTN